MLQPQYQVPLRDSEAHHIYVLSDKSAEWRYYRFLAAGKRHYRRCAITGNDNLILKFASLRD